MEIDNIAHAAALAAPGHQELGETVGKKVIPAKEVYCCDVVVHGRICGNGATKADTCDREGIRLSFRPCGHVVCSRHEPPKEAGGCLVCERTE